jgi:hypothetical protein
MRHLTVILLLLSLNVFGEWQTLNFYGTGAFYGGEPLPDTKPFTLSVTFDRESPGTPVGQRQDYPNAIRILRFDYDNGSYRHGVTNVGGISILDGDDDSIGIWGDFQFPPLAGKPYSGFNFSLSDSSGRAFTNTGLPDHLVLSSFGLREFQLSWGIDFDAVSFLGTITHTRNEAELLGITTTNNSVAVRILLPDKPCTNFIEAVPSLNSPESWTVLGGFSSDSSGEIIWFQPLQSSTNSFFRVRTE